MPRRERKFGPHRRVHTVDVTGLYCNLRVFGAADDHGTMPVIEGSWRAVGKVKEELASSAAGIELTLTNGAGSVSRTGAAQTHVVRAHEAYRRTVPDSPVTVTLFVKYGTRVLH
jgi:hypothetical protein